ncbi:UNVERIFIED_CONTAM: Calmodulin-binding protein 25 [Sesamum angustifolium]|uniref:Calmodulin-binding protein 25 n=1 Tax=Sesamum angustifolium TaxID=2727405 RepID=A0AAW2PW40_9LAMI
MASSDNLMTMEQPWSFRLPFADSWISDIYTKETDALTKVLQKSFDATSSDGDAFSTEMVESLFPKPEVTPLQTPTASGGSENEAPVSKQRRSVPPSGRVTKRKSRASKRATTTFITADPANFRQMVQQVTGVRFGGLNGQLPMAPVLKPEPHRVVSRLQPSSALPTLDTSAFLLDGCSPSLVAQLPPPSTVMGEVGATASGLELDSFCSFPTLESWKVM